MASPAVTAQTLGSARGGFTGTVGWRFTALTAVTVTALGRWVLSGNSATHTLYMYDASSHSVVGTVSLNTSGQPSGAFAYANLGTSFVLVVGHDYECLSAEVSGSDQFCDPGSITVDATIATTYGTCVDNTPPTGGGIGTAGKSYVPTSFLFTNGGTTYDVSAAESVTASDAVDSAADFSSSTAETVATVDSDASNATFITTAVDSVTVMDASTCVVLTAAGWPFDAHTRVPPALMIPRFDHVQAEDEEIMELAQIWLNHLSARQN